MSFTPELAREWNMRIVEVSYAYGPRKDTIVDSRGQLLEYKGNLYLCLHMDVENGSELRIKDVASNNTLWRFVRELLSSEIRPYMIMTNTTGAIYYYEMYADDGTFSTQNALKNLLNSARSRIMKLLGRK